MNMLEKIQFQLEHLSRSERKVTEAILASPNNTTHSDIVALVPKTNVSEPMVDRFCHSVDIRGLPDLKPHLVQGLANSTLYINRSVNRDNSVESYMGKVSEPAMATLDHVRHSLDKSTINCAVGLLTQTKKIAFFGLSLSATVVHDAMNRFFRSNVPMVYSDDIVLQRMSCMDCSDGDVVVLISHIGRTENLVELAQLARENDATVIILTSAGTPLVRETTLATTLDVPEDTGIYMSMISRLAQLTVIDVLATGLTLRCSAKFRDNLKRVKKALKESCFNKRLPSLGDDH